MKRALKCGISLLVFLATAASTSLAALFGHKQKGTCVILYYHSVPAEQRVPFARQLDVLLRNAKPIDISRELVLERGQNHAAVTFDDGFENFVEVALPELANRKIPSVMFMIADAFGKAFGPVGRAEKVMSVIQAQSLPQELVTLGSHTSSHPFLPSLSESDARRELAESRRKLEQVLDRKISLFSFPFGGFTEQLVGYCREAGYQRVFTTLPEFVFENSDAFVLGRVRVDPTDWPIEFRLKLAGAYRWLPRAFALKRALLRAPLAGKVLSARNQRNSRPAPQSRIHELNA